MSDLALSKLDFVQQHEFCIPNKRIHDGADVTFFLTTLAYRDIVQFILQLNRGMVPRKGSIDDSSKTTSWPLTDNESEFSTSVLRLRELISSLRILIAQAPPDPGPRRFGNVSFRKWYALVEEQLQTLLAKCMSEEIPQAREEIGTYLMGSFGSPQRLDYGTGHELSFLAFLGCLWKIGYFSQTDPGIEERGIVIGVFEPYLNLIRDLIKIYNLEPAGSHGVWGLDDNSFLPYLFGSAQLAPAISETDDTPIQGSISSAPDPSSVAKSNLVDKEKDRNMYFSAIAFIYDVKKGPFWEHSPILYDISGIKDGWGKINKGMVKMYNAEVLSKFPVVQHFPFGSLFKWEKDPSAKAPPPTSHTMSQPLRNPVDSHIPASARPMGPPSTAAPWVGGTRVPPPKGFVNGVTQAPWTSRTPAPPPARGFSVTGNPRGTPNKPARIMEENKDDQQP